MQLSYPCAYLTSCWHRYICKPLSDHCQVTCSWYLIIPCPQFHSETSECRVGGPVRLGLEASGVDAWCEPFPPTEWNGARILSRSNGVCQLGQRLPYQCFGLGPERLSKDGNRLDAAACEAACCESPGCDMWQQGDGRGCYYTLTGE